MRDENLKERTRKVAVEIIKLVEKLPKTRTASILVNQILRSGTSVGANYRAACRARSRADFISKMGIVEEEADETLYWLDLLVEARLVKREEIEYLINEVNEFVAITISSIKTARKNKP